MAKRKAEESVEALSSSWFFLHLIAWLVVWFLAYLAYKNDADIHRVITQQFIDKKGHGLADGISATMFFLYIITIVMLVSSIAASLVLLLVRDRPNTAWFKFEVFLTEILLLVYFVMWSANDLLILGLIVALAVPLAAPAVTGYVKGDPVGIRGNDENSKKARKTRKAKISRL